MARTPKNLALGQLADTALTEIYDAPIGINTSSAVLAFTNTTNVAISLDIYHGNGTDFLQRTMTLPAGPGRERIYYGFQQRVLNAGDTVKIQADSANALNFTLSGSEIEV